MIHSFVVQVLVALAWKVSLVSKSEPSDILKALLSCKRYFESPCQGIASTFLCCIWHSFPSSWTFYLSLSQAEVHTKLACQSNRALVTFHATCGELRCWRPAQSLKSGTNIHISLSWKRKIFVLCDCYLKRLWTLVRRNLWHWLRSSAQGQKRQWKET